MFTQFQGFIGEKKNIFIRLFKAELLDDINRRYLIAEYLPNYKLIGSDAALEGVFISPDGKVVQIPFIPLSVQYERILFGSLQQFKEELGRGFSRTSVYPADATRMAVHPIALGGSPTDPANFKDAPEDIHVKATVYWNKVYADALRRDSKG
jgi:hypothetical protein